MKGVFIRVSASVSIADAITHLESLGYEKRWREGVDPIGVSVLIGECTGRIGWASVNENIEGYNLQEIFTPTKHKHYDLIVKWASDTTQKVWYKGSDDWRPVEISPSWRYEYDWHIGEQPPKRKIKIGDAEIDAPEVVGLKHGQGYYLPIINGQNVTWAEFTWHNAQHQFDLLKRGLVHLNKEAAIAHAKALIKVSGGCVDE